MTCFRQGLYIIGQDPRIDVILGIKTEPIIFTNDLDECFPRRKDQKSYNLIPAECQSSSVGLGQ